MAENMIQSKIYRSWSNMKTRCYNPKATKYYLWGGRGIKVCDRWLKFDGFFKDMGPSYIEGYQIDRINNDGNYEPSNCKWSSPTEQSRNRRSNRFIEYKGQIKTVAEWASLSGLKPSAFRQRLYCMHWTLEKCLTTKALRQR